MKNKKKYRSKEISIFRECYKIINVSGLRFQNLAQTQNLRFWLFMKDNTVEYSRQMFHELLRWVACS